MKYYTNKENNFGKFFYAENDALAIAYARGYADAKNWQTTKRWRVRNIDKNRAVLNVTNGKNKTVEVSY